MPINDTEISIRTDSSGHIISASFKSSDDNLALVRDDYNSYSVKGFLNGHNIDGHMNQLNMLQTIKDNIKSNDVASIEVITNGKENKSVKFSGADLGKGTEYVEKLVDNDINLLKSSGIDITVTKDKLGHISSVIYSLPIGRTSHYQKEDGNFQEDVDSSDKPSKSFPISHEDVLKTFKITIDKYPKTIRSIEILDPESKNEKLMEYSGDDLEKAFKILKKQIKHDLKEIKREKPPVEAYGIYDMSKLASLIQNHGDNFSAIDTGNLKPSSTPIELVANLQKTRF